MMYIPTYTNTAPSATAAFREGIKIMELMGEERITLPDEAPLRMILASCLDHHKPMTAVRVLNAAKNVLKLQINAATYALYNQVLLEAKWPENARDGYTLWKLLKNTVLATIAFMEPIDGYRRFRSPVPENKFNMNMGLNHASIQAAKTGSSRSLEGAFHVSTSDIDVNSKEKVFEPRTDSPSALSVDTLNLNASKSDDKEGGLPKPDLGFAVSQSNPNLSKTVDPATPTRSSPAVIAAHPKSKAVAKTSWGLGSISKSLTIDNLGLSKMSEKLGTSSPMKYFQSPKAQQMTKAFTDTVDSLTDTVESVKASPSYNSLKDVSKKSWVNFSAAAKTMMDNMDGKVEPEEGSSEDSMGVDDDGKRCSLPRRHRPNSAEQSLSDGTASVKSATIMTPDIFVTMSVACTCSVCSAPLYEEEIMAGWTSDPNNMRTFCPWCRKTTVPELSVLIEDRRGKVSYKRIPPMAFLSPMVLRKELETLLVVSGEKILREQDFIDHHKMIFWNLYYAFEKMKLKHSLDQLLASSLASSDQDDDSGSHSLKEMKPLVGTYLNWDSTLANKSTPYPPLYRIFKEFQKPEAQQNRLLVSNSHIKRDTLITIVESIKNNDCQTPLMKLLYLCKNLTGNSEENLARRSCYREAQFLLVAAVGQRNIDFTLFDRYWQKAHEILQDHAKQLRNSNDQTPNQRVYNCRKIFGEPRLLC